MIEVGTELVLTAEENEEFYCKVQEVEKEKLYVDYPVHSETRKTSFFLEGTEFKGSYVGKDAAVYQFETQVVSRKKLTIPVLEITFPGQEFLKRIQRRRYVRTKTSVDVAINTKDRNYHTVTADLSGGGAAFVQPVDAQFNKGQHIYVTMVLPMNSGGYNYVETEAVIIRQAEPRGSTPGIISVKFEGLAEKDRQTIIKYGFEQQRYMKNMEYK
ncbi:flagellar brake protein [Salimicrobium jeotgali]|uniref:flagellar brake protein n=1 Tax=Salimicrobium jeotgali TaxID=1230341 RepID=UPI000C832E4C|nr:flagellar brake domain-containing protein [Salimicrobium jeotgali]